MPVARLACVRTARRRRPLLMRVLGNSGTDSPVEEARFEPAVPGAALSSHLSARHANPPLSGGGWDTKRWPCELGE
jgi:hypothetical protein